MLLKVGRSLVQSGDLATLKEAGPALKGKPRLNEAGARGWVFVRSKYFWLSVQILSFDERPSRYPVSVIGSRRRESRAISKFSPLLYD